jgi:hypothetical protein
MQLHRSSRSSRIRPRENIPDFRYPTTAPNRLSQRATETGQSARTGTLQCGATFISGATFITGALRGFGRDWPEAALQRGNNVAATARRPETLDVLVDTYGDAVLPLRLDVTDRDAA